MRFILTIISALFLGLSSCSPEEENFFELSEFDQDLVNTVSSNATQLSTNPLDWTDEEISFLDEIAKVDIIGMGEATHGTAEFFNAKFRVFKYLVENHGYKVFAIEADFGESIFLNKAISEGDEAGVLNYMKSKMHFWTWRTEEVYELLTWMARYNLGIPEDQKLRYVGVDCQFNTFHPELLEEKLVELGGILKEIDYSVLTDLKALDESLYKNLSEEGFDLIEERVLTLQSLFNERRKEIVELKGEAEYELMDQLFNVIKQVIAINKNRVYFFSRDLRDTYMGQNTKWAYEYYGREKTLVWAHNVHIEVRKPNNSQAQGNVLDREYMTYETIGFSFSRGKFTAFEFDYNSETGLSVGELKEHEILTSPRKGSLNHYFYSTKIPAFYINMNDLRLNKNWFLKLSNNIEHLSIGSSYNGNPGDFYYEISDTNYDHLIYFDEKTTATTLIER